MLAPVKDICQHSPVMCGDQWYARATVTPASSHKAPRFIAFSVINPATGDLHIARMQCAEERLVDRCERMLFAMRE
jgi:hypothetical protein